MYRVDLMPSPLLLQKCDSTWFCHSLSRASRVRAFSKSQARKPRGFWSMVAIKRTLRLRFTAGTRQVPKPRKQRCEMRPVLLRHGREFQSKSVTRLNMPHDRLGPDLSFLDEEIELGFHSHRPWTRSSNGQTSRA